MKQFASLKRTREHASSLQQMRGSKTRDTMTSMSMTRVLYRLEWILLTLIALVLAISHIVWSLPISIVLVIACAVLPDIPIALFQQGTRWVFVLYNLCHSLAVWGGVTTFAFLLGWQWRWTLFIWLVHIGLDRALGYALRDSNGHIHPAGD